MNWLRNAKGEDDAGRDMVVARALESLDPASQDPNYWFRFHHRVMAGAGRELARRRRMVELTISDVLASWSRTVVPTAMLAAAVAALMLVRAGSGTALEPGSVAELLVTDIPASTASALLADDAPVIFASLNPDVF